MSRDPFWKEIEEIDQRRHPRLEERFGHCPLCRKTATRVLSIHYVTWGCCERCAETWVVGEHILELNNDALRCETYLKYLATFSTTQLSAPPAPLKGLTTMTPQTPTPTLPAIEFDVRDVVIAGAKFEGPLLRGVYLSIRRRVTGHSYDILRANPNATPLDVHRLAHRVIDRLHDDLMDGGKSVAYYLQHQHEGSTVHGELCKVIGVLMAGGTLRTTLLQRRSEIDQALALLEPLATEQV